MILEIDAGNSRIKWRLLDSDAQVLDRGVCAAYTDLQAILPALSGLQRLRVASVRDAGSTAALIDLLQQRWTGVCAEIARVVPSQAGVTNSYSNYQTFGIDRWLAMLAAYNRSHDRCCIISCGTAVTLDVINAAGIHQGGFIVPGLSLQRKSLLQNTSIRLPSESQWSSSWSSVTLGCSTEDAVNHGIFTMLVSAVARLPVVAEISAMGGLYLTGGDAAVISTGLHEYGINHKCDQDIILDGLAYALP